MNLAAKPGPIHPKPGPSTPPPKPGPKNPIAVARDCVRAWGRVAYAVAELTVSIAKGRPE